MKTITLLAVLTLLLCGLGTNAWAHEGGTKLVATMTHPETGNIQAGPSLSTLEYGVGGTKLIVQFLHRTPEPTLSAERIREESRGSFLGTKSLVRFQK